jgi:nucleotide-binding universal stress UspA family protein
MAALPAAWPKGQKMPGIVVGVDGSAGSQLALTWAAREAAAHHAPLTVLTVHQVMASYWTGLPVTYPADAPAQEKARQAAEEATQKVTSELGDSQPASVTITAVNGLIAEELINASRDADLVVVGSRGAGGFAALVLGSVTTQVVSHSSCPVVVIPSPR